MQSGFRIPVPYHSAILLFCICFVPTHPLTRRVALLSGWYVSVFLSSFYPMFLKDGGGGGEGHHFRILSSKLDPLMGFQNRPS